MSHLEQEIHEQPEVIRRLIEAEWAHVQAIRQAIADFNPEFVHIAARGTSDNAGRYAQYLFGIHAGLPVALATPSVHTLYESSPRLGRALVIGISQSGQSEDIRRVVEDGRKQGALTISITNDANSPMAQASEHHIPLHAGQEKAVAATKSYTAQLTAVAMLGAALNGAGEMTAELQKLPGYAAQTLQLAAPISTWAERYRYMERLVTLGRGYNYCTAFEVGLKIKELCYVVGQEFSEADFRHGPIAVIQPGFPVITVAMSGKALLVILDLLHKLGERQAECLVISNDDAALGMGHKGMRVPAVPEWISPIVGVIPGQVFAMSLAAAKGYDLDQPRGLTKVTYTI
jgi:glucosamine--fructose-6-phosphate aminotransferase (isomerizing)